MRSFVTACWTLFLLAILGLVAWLLGLGDAVRHSLQAGHLLDWIMGLLCFLWLLVILKAPWDLYFQALEVSFDLKRSQEKGIPIPAGREAYLHALRRRLGWLAVGAHLFSAALIAGVAYYSGGKIGYYFAAFYLASTVFRPAVAGYVYLERKLRAINQEVRYPREDVVEIREKLKWQEITIRDLTDQMKDCRQGIEQEKHAREAETWELRQNVHALGREFETTVSRLTDNQEVIKGIQAFVRLIAQSAQS